MANEEQLKILSQGVDVWNRWRGENPDVKFDFMEADLRGVDLRKAELWGGRFLSAKLYGANLNEANLSGTDLRKADLRKTKLREAKLLGTRLEMANLSETNLSYAHVLGANLSGSNLDNASLNEANLKNSNLDGASLSGTDLTNGLLGSIVLGDNDLSQTVGLETIRHQTPSTIGTNTLQKSRGNISVTFLRGCGLSDWEIESAKLYNPELSNHEIDEILYKVHDLRATQPLQISPLFISYSHVDSPFVEKIEEHLNAKGIRFWRDVHHATAGRLEKQIDRAIRHNPTVLVILSENSIKSDWVEHEVRTARELEKESGHDVLCPVALDDSWKTSSWPKRVMEQVMEYNILDFSRWKDDTEFERLFKKLIDGLELFYK